MRTAHGLGIRSSSTIMFGHVDAPPHRVAHLRRLAAIQRDTGGFTEFVPLPFVYRNAPIYLAGKARPGPTPEDSIRMHAVARIVLDRVIPNVQVSWVKLGVEACQRILTAGANDFGGTLMEETISRMAGSEWGIEMTPDRFDDAIRAIGAYRAIRTTTYERVVLGARTAVPSARLTASVNLIDQCFSCLERLPRAISHDTMGVERWGMRQGTSSVCPLSSRAFFPQNHTRVIRRGARSAPLHPLARASTVS